jgi:hypothetical protein
MMPRRPRGTIAAIVSACVLAGCATSTTGKYDLRSVRNHGMSPYVVHEECLRVTPGEKIEYYFTSTFPLNFNIHYREGGTVVMPIVKDRVTEDAGIYAPRIAQDYCLMWEAGATGATIDYGVRLRAVTSG